MTEERAPELDASELLDALDAEGEATEELDLNDCNDWECEP